jgi:hypothetical protein
MVGRAGAGRSCMLNAQMVSGGRAGLIEERTMASLAALTISRRLVVVLSVTN